MAVFGYLVHAALSVLHKSWVEDENYHSNLLEADVSFITHSQLDVLFIGTRRLISAAII